MHQPDRLSCVLFIANTATAAGYDGDACLKARDSQQQQKQQQHKVLVYPAADDSVNTAVEQLFNRSDQAVRKRLHEALIKAIEFKRLDVTVCKADVRCMNKWHKVDNRVWMQCQHRNICCVLSC